MGHMRQFVVHKYATATEFAVVAAAANVPVSGVECRGQTDAMCLCDHNGRHYK